MIKALYPNTKIRDLNKVIGKTVQNSSIPQMGVCKSNTINKRIGMSDHERLQLLNIIC